MLSPRILLSSSSRLLKKYGYGVIRVTLANRHAPVVAYLQFPASLRSVLLVALLSSGWVFSGTHPFRLWKFPSPLRSPLISVVLTVYKIIYNDSDSRS
jgi:hypothetical protein